jgi:hypothetical protein
MRDAATRFGPTQALRAGRAISITAAAHPAYLPKGRIHGVPSAQITMVLELRYSSWFVSPVGEPARQASFGKYDVVGQCLSVLTVLCHKLMSTGVSAVLEGARRDHVLDMAFLVVVFVASIIVINPLGDFPLNDDWSFARAVQGLIQQGDWRPTGFTAMPLITQSLWGSAFCLPAGFSFNALRCSTLTLAILGILGVYVLFITNNRERFLAIIAAVTLGFNPLYYELSTTFMTDVPFTALAILSSIFYVRCIRLFNYFDLSIACVLSLVATLCRQLGLFLPLAFVAALLIQRGCSRRWVPQAVLPSLVPAVFPTLVCVAALVLFQEWMTMTGRLPALYGTSWAAQDLSIRGIGSRTVTGLLYLGLFCLPILLIAPNTPQSNSRNIVFRILPTLLAAVFALVSICFAFNRLQTLMPISSNILIPQGLGPYSTQKFEPLPSWFWSIVTILSLVGGVLLVSKMTASTMTLIEKIRMANLNNEDVIQIFFLVAVSAYALPIFLTGLFDRYLVPLVPFVLYLSTSGLRQEGRLRMVGKPAAAVLVASTALFAVLGTRDYLMWHRVRWAALIELQRTVNIQDIDGGFEFNGWFTNGTIDKKTVKKILLNDDAEYRIGTSEWPGFTVIKKYEYFTLIFPKLRTFFVLRRDVQN